jgi:hypothetical protein
MTTADHSKAKKWQVQLDKGDDWITIRKPRFDRLGIVWYARRSSDGSKWTTEHNPAYTDVDAIQTVNQNADAPSPPDRYRDGEGRGEAVTTLAQLDFIRGARHLVATPRPIYITLPWFGKVKLFSKHGQVVLGHHNTEMLKAIEENLCAVKWFEAANDRKQATGNR